MFKRILLVVILSHIIVSRLNADVIFTVNASSNVATDPDPSDWLATVDAVSTFLTEAANIQLADEVGSLPTNNTVGLGGASGALTFDSANTALPWSFTVSAPGSLSPLNATSGFTYNDIDGLSPPIWLTGTLSPGDIDDHEDDDVTWEITSGPDLFGFAFDIIDSIDFGVPETVQVFGAGDLLLGTFDIPQPTGGGNDVNLFIGITSNSPIKKIIFDEDNGGDDIGVRDFRFAAVSIPEPSPILLFSTLALGLGMRWLSHSRDS